MRSRRALTAGFLLALLAACGSGPERGVNVKTVATDLVYGIPPTSVPAPPANLGGTPENSVGVLFSGSVNEARRPRRTPPPARAPECPEAPLDKFPDPATSSVKGKPLAGQYMWRVTGTQDAGALGRVPLPRSTLRRIENVTTSEAAANMFSFTVVERDLRFGSRTIVHTTYEVRPDDGIFLTKIEREIQGGDTSTFDPTPDVEILPLPVELGVDVNSVGVDPTTFEVMRIQGAVPKRQRVDACGDPVDSFFVNATQQFVSATGETVTRNYDYGVATQLGGMIVYEDVDAPCESQDEAGKCTPEPTMTFTAHLGQLEPDR